MALILFIIAQNTVQATILYVPLHSKRMNPLHYQPHIYPIQVFYEAKES